MKNANVVWMFSGQGSQYPNMGLDLYKKDPTFQSCLDELDAVAIKRIGTSVVNAMYNRHFGIKESNEFQRILLTHPALFMVQFALSKALFARGMKPDFVLGSSLGEFVAAAVAGVATPESLLEEVIDHAMLIESDCASGGMLAILASPNIFYDMSLAYNNCELVSINSSGHFVVSGEQAAIDALEAYLKQKSITCYRLDVSYGFHSSAIEAALDGIDNRARNRKNYSRPSISYISSCEGTGLLELDKDHFRRVLRKPIRFSEAIGWVEKMSGQNIYMDLGVTPTLSKFVEENLSNFSHSKSLSIMNPFGNDFENLLEAEKLMTVDSMMEKCA